MNTTEPTPFKPTMQIAGYAQSRVKLATEIKFKEFDLPDIVDRAIAKTVKAGAEIYARRTTLVRPVHISTPGEHDIVRAEGSTILVPLDKVWLREKLTKLITWHKYDKRAEAYVPIACPAIVSETIISRRGDWLFPQLRAVVSAPTLRPDKSILNAPGFDTETGILFASDLKWPEIPNAPSKADAEAARDTLNDLISGFPFADPAADRSGALALILTALARPCLRSAPMFGVNAPTPGTGKSKLVDVAAVLATGNAAAVMSATRDEAELEKRLGSAMIAGDQFLTLDNVEHPLRSEFLCQVLTQAVAQVRILGKSEKLDLPTTATFCATGNSLRIAGDLTRRVVLINLDAGVERPEDRIFTTDVIEEAKSRRIELVTAGLTILRAFVVSRGRKAVPALGSFEAWSDLIRSALMWLGEADPLGNAERVRENDPERERTAAILAALPPGKWTAGDIGRMIQQDREPGVSFRRHEALGEALVEFMDRGGGQLNTMRFGHFLRKHSGRIVDGLKIVSCGRDQKNSSLWTVEDTREVDAPAIEF